MGKWQFSLSILKTSHTVSRFAKPLHDISIWDVKVDISMCCFYFGFVRFFFFSLRQNSWKRTAFACSRLRLEWKLEPVGLGRWAQESIWKFLASGPSWPRTVVHKTLGCLGANKDLGTIGWLFRCEIYTVHDGAPPVISCFIHHSRYRLDIL